MKQALCHLIDLSTILVFYLIFWAAVIFFGGYHLSWDNLYIGAPFIAIKELPFPYPNWFKYSFLAALSLAVLIPLFNPFRSKSGKYGSAHFATEKEIKKMNLRDDQGIILAVKGKKYIRTNEPLSVNIYAPPGTGKTASIIIPTLISCSNSMIVHDPKGELYAKTHKRRSEFSRIVKFSPGERGSLRWNPLSKEELPREWADIQVHVDRVSQTVIPDNPKNPGDHWPRAGRNFFMFWALFLIHRDGETSLPDILKEPYQTDDMRNHIAEIIDEYGDNLPERVLFEGNGLLQTAEAEFGSIQSTFKTNLSVFFDERVDQNLSGSDFALKDLRTERTTIYLTVKNNDQSRLKSLLGLFFETCTNAMLDHEPTKDEYRVTALIDEAARIAKMQELINMPAIGRSYKFNAIFVWQSPGQVMKIYGKEDTKELLNTCAYHVYFTQNDPEFAEQISKSIGDLTRDKISEGENKGFRRSKNISKEGYKLMTAQDVMSMPVGKILVMMQYHFKTPILTDASFWFKDPALKAHVEDVDYKDLSEEPSQTLNEAPKATISPVPVLAADPDPGGQGGEPHEEDQDQADEETEIVLSVSDFVGEDPDTDITEEESIIDSDEEPEFSEDMDLDDLMEWKEPEENEFSPEPDFSMDDVMSNFDEDEDEDECPRP